MNSQNQIFGSDLAKGIIITGMRRSGTSLTANILRSMGVSFHDDARSADNSNKDGYWESRKSELLNEGILGYLGGDQDRPPPTPSGWQKKAKLQKLRGSCESFISELESRDLWGWKETRLCITLPFWKNLLPRGIRYLLCIRNPLEVARSWNRMDKKVDLGTASSLWFSFTANALKNTLNEPTLLVFYEDYFLDPEKQIAAISNFTNLPYEQSVVSLTAREMRHQEASLKDVLTSSFVSDRSKLLYFTLLLSKSDQEMVRTLQHGFSNFSESFSPWPRRLLFRLRYLSSFGEGSILSKILRNAVS